MHFEFFNNFLPYNHFSHFSHFFGHFRDFEVIFGVFEFKIKVQNVIIDL